MLSLLKLVDQFNAIERKLPADWAEVSVGLTVDDDTRVARAAAMLGPANPGRFRNTLRFGVARRGRGVAPEAARRLLRRLVQEGIDGKLEVYDVRTAAVEDLLRQETLNAQWEGALASLPPGWSDVYAEVRFDSTDYVERAALLLAPVNPARYGGANALRFRCAHHFGYGVSPEMAGRCVERCDEEGMTGEVEILRALSDTHPVGTQGPVWLVGGRTV